MSIKNLPRLGLFLTILIWIVIWAAIILPHQQILHKGEEVILKTRAVDPRDLLRGDYIILDYEIGRLDRTATYNYKRSHPIYISLKKDAQGVASAVDVSQEKPQDGLFIQGVYHSSWRGIQFPSIQNYFVPESKGLTLERLRGSDRLEVRVSIDASGQALIKDLLLDGEPVDFSEIERTRR